MISKLARKKNERSRKSRKELRKRLRLETLERREMLSTVAWSVGPALSAPRSDASALLAPDNAIIVLGGETSGDARQVPKLSSTATSWTSAHDLEIERVALGAARTGGNGILAFGGLDGNEATDEVLAYDYFFGDSQDVGKLAAERSDFGYASDEAFRAYAIGGLDKESIQVLDSVERYDAATELWSFVAALPEARHGVATVSDDVGHLYVFGGSSTVAAGDIEATSYRYTVSTNTWDTVAPMPEATQDSAAVVDDDGTIYILGGQSASGTVATVQVYDPITNTWTTDTDLPVATHSHAAVLDSLSRINVIGGIDASGSQVATVYRSQRLDIPETAPLFTSSPDTTGSLDDLYGYVATTNANPEAVYSLMVFPAGMTIDSLTGQVSWQPVEGQQGQHAVTVRAENRVGTVDQSYTLDIAFDTINPSAPSSLAVDGVGTTTIDLSWQPATDNRGISHYEVLKGYRSGFRGRNTSYRVIQTDITGTSTTLTGLGELSSHKLVVRAVDTSGNVSLRSNQVFTQTQSAPVIRYYANGLINTPVAVTANHLLEIHLTALANPAPTYAIIDGPAGITLDPISGLLQWTPTATDAGAQNVTVEATNSVGSSQLVIPITVRADLPVLSVQFNPNANSARFALAGVPFELQVGDLSNTLSTFSLVDAPAGMTIDTNTGLLQWAPTSADAGPTTVVIRGTNSAGSTDRAVTFETFFTASPTNLLTINEALLQPTVSWTAPVGDGAGEVTGYTVTATARYRHGRARRTHTVTVDAPGTGTTTEIEGLLTGKQYSITVQAYNAAGNVGAPSTEAVTLVPVPAIPNVSWTISTANNGAVVANQPVEIQLNNLSADPATFSLISGPVGLTIDSLTGLATWTPGVNDIGFQSIQFRATNSVGPRDITVGVNVFFSGMVGNVIADRTSTTTANVSWTAPTDNVAQIVSYKITLHWRWSGRRRSRSFTVPATQLSAAVALIPTGAVSHRGVSITALDGLGRAGVSTPLIDYI